jgi:hypothetical protein
MQTKILILIFYFHDPQLSEKRLHLSEIKISVKKTIFCAHTVMKSGLPDLKSVMAIFGHRQFQKGGKFFGYNKRYNKGQI